MAKSRKMTHAASVPQLMRMAQLLARQSASEHLRPDIPARPRAEPKEFFRTQYVRAAEVARHFNVDVRTVRRWIKGETLPSVRVGGARLVAVADLDRLLSPPLDQVDVASDETPSE